MSELHPIPRQTLGMAGQSIKLASVGGIKVGRKPARGDRVMVPDFFTDEFYSGFVVDLLSVQFTYETASGTIRYCFYSADWKYQ